MTYLETIKVLDGEFENLPAHLDRMRRTIGRALLPPLVVPDTFSHGRVKCRILYSATQVLSVGYSHYRLPSINSLMPVDGTGVDYSAKYADRSALDTLMATRGTCDDILIIQSGHVTDTSFCNVVFENRHGLFTPATPLLRGTKRQRLIDMGRITEQPITISDIGHYDRLRLVNAMIDLEDDLSIDIGAVAHDLRSVK